MADHAPLLSIEDFTEEQMERIERAANGAPRAWLRRMVLELAAELENQPRPVEEEPAPGKPEASLPVAVADPAAAALLGRLAGLEESLAELKAWTVTLLSELYAHTGFPDTPEGRRMEREKRAAAARKIEEMIKPSVAAEMARRGAQRH